MAVLIPLLTLVAFGVSVITWRQVWKGRSDIVRRPDEGWLWERPRREIIRFGLITVPMVAVIVLLVSRLPHGGIGGAVVRVASALVLLFAVLRLRKRAD